MPNGQTTEDQIKSLWKAVKEKQDITMCNVMTSVLQADINRLSIAIEKLTVKMEDLITTTWRIKLKLAVLIAGSGTIGGGITALIFKLIAG